MLSAKLTDEDLFSITEVYSDTDGSVKAVRNVNGVHVKRVALTRDSLRSLQQPASADGMSILFPPSPSPTEPLDPCMPNADVRDFLARRRSAGKRTLRAPGPDPETLNEILRVAARVPDHRRLEPWRFIVFEGDRREAFGTILADIKASNEEDADDKTLQEERDRFLRAPVVIAVISSPDVAHKTPVWEQELSCGAVCQNLLIAANAAGWAGCWLTEWIAYDAGVSDALGLGEHERVAGFVYLGTCEARPPERPRPDMATKISRWMT
ncbi:MAG: nitroreductase [Pseudomonadota bacterium]